MGCKTLLTPEVAGKILAAIRGGNYPLIAARFAGIKDHTFNDWLARGESDDPRDALYAEFRAAVERAEAEVEVASTASLMAWLRKNPKEWLAFAARRWPERWGRRDVVDVTGKVEHHVGVALLPPLASLASFVHQEPPRALDAPAEVVDGEAGAGGPLAAPPGPPDGLPREPGE